MPRFSPKNTALFSVIIKGSWYLIKAGHFLRWKFLGQTRAGGVVNFLDLPMMNRTITYPTYVWKRKTSSSKSYLFWGREMLHSSLEGNPQKYQGFSLINHPFKIRKKHVQKPFTRLDWIGMDPAPFQESVLSLSS